MRRAAAIGLALGAYLPQAHAAEPGCDAATKRPWIAVDAGSGLRATDVERIRRELRADLAPQAIDVCDVAREGEPIARIVLSPALGAEAVSIRVEIRDALTQKEVARVLTTTNIPTDGRALAIAVAAAELLRASWAELALRSAPAASMPVPLPVKRIVRDSIARSALPASPAPRIVGLGVALAGEAFTSGFVRLGADVRASVDLGARAAAGVRVGFRRAVSMTTVDGTVDADALVFGAEGAVALVSRVKRWNVEVLARADVAVISFHATPLAGATAAAATLPSFEASGGLRGSVWITPSLGLFAEVGAGGAIISATAKDGTTEVASTSGAMIFASVAANGRF